MAFNSFAAVGRNADDKGMHWQYVYKASTPAPGTARFFVDCNQSAGQPKYNPFSGNAQAANQLAGDGNFGVYTGSFEAGKSKHLLRWQMRNTTAASSVPDYIHLCDYLTFYPLIDGDDPDPQVLDNSVGLPRYTSGAGVRMVLVAQSPIASSVPVTISYTNEQGVSGRTTTFNLIPGAAIGVVLSGVGSAGGAGQASPFINLASGDQGVRRVDSVTVGGSAGGFFCICLVKPLATLSLVEANCCTEKLFGLDQRILPEILPGAYLNFLINRGNTAACGYQGELLFVNS